MNHIYKVIFNKATGTFMAVAEYAKSHSTGGSCATGQVGSVRTLSFTRVAALAVLVIGATLSGSAYASTGPDSKVQFGETGHGDQATATGEASLAIGSLSQARGKQSIAIGGSKPYNGSGKNSSVGPHAQGHESIAIGGDVTAQGHASIAIGSDDLYLEDQNGTTVDPQVKSLISRHRELNNIQKGINGAEKYRRTKAEGHASTAVGTMAYAKGHFSNAFGTRATAEGVYSLAVGLTALAKAESSIAVGSNAQANELATTAIGGSAQVNSKRGIALGFDSKVTIADNKVDAYIPTATYQGNLQIDPSHQATQDWGPLSIGSKNNKRKIINVGAGYNDTDAVNVAQLKVAAGLANRKITFKGDDNNGVDKQLGQTLTIKGGKTKTGELTENNIGVVKDNDNGGGLKVQLAKDLTGLNNITAAGTITVNAGTNTAKLLNSGLTFTQTNTGGKDSGKTLYGHDGVKFTNDSNSSTATKGTTRIAKERIGFADADDRVDTASPYLDKKQLKVGSVEITTDSGINAGNQKITGLADGAQDGDAVTIKQLKNAKPNLIGDTGISVTPTEISVNAQSGDVTAPTYTISVKTTELTSTGNGNSKFAVNGGNTNNDSLVTAKNLADYLNQVNETADNALPNFKVQNDNDVNSAITVAKNGANGNTVNTLKLKGENGLNIKTDPTGTVTFGINKSGLTTPMLTVGSNGTTQLVIEQVAGTGNNDAKNIIKGLSPTLPGIIKEGGVRTTKQGDITTSEDRSKAASITDVLNAGFNLKNNDADKGFISTYDTVDFANGEATTAKVTYDEASKTSKVTYDVNVDGKTIHLTGDNGKKNKIGVKTTTLQTSANGDKATNFNVKSGDEDALVKAKDIAENLNTLAGEIRTTKGTADTALQTFTVKKVKENGDDDNDADTITVGQEKSGQVNTLKLKGKNGLDIKTDKNGTVTFGINTQSGLKAGDNTTLNNNGLSIKNPTGSEQIQVGADGVKFAMVNKGAAGAGIDGTSRITKDQIGFANSTGQVDINKPHLSKDGINAGGKKITNIQSGEITQNSNDAVTGGKIYDLKTELESKISSTAKTAQNSLHEFSVADEHGNNFTVSNPYSSYDTSKTSDVITFAGENGITTKVNKGVVRVGIDQTKGLTTPKLTVGNNNGKGIVIDSQNGQNTITGLSNTLANVTNDGAGHALSQGLADNTDKTRAASIGDVLNAGFNLQGNGTAVDFVSTYDTVNFANGNTTTAKVTYDDTSKTSKVVYDVNVDDTTIEVKDKKLGVKTTTLTSTGTGANKFALSNQATGDALVKASDIVAHLNTLSGDIQTAKGASQANNSAGYVDADGNKVIYDSTDNKYYQAKNDGTVDKTKEVAKDKLVAQAQTPDGTLAQMNVKSVINKEQVNDANKKQGINEDNAFVKGLEKAASDNKTKNAAVTVGDLNAVAQTPLTFAGDTGTTAKKLGETLTIKGGQTDTNKLTDNNIGVVAGTDGFTVKLAKDLTNLNSVNAGGTKIDDKGVSFVDSSGQAKANTPVLSANGLDLGGKVISNVGKGTKDTDAANVQQLNEVRNLLGLGNAGNDNADGNQVNIADIKKDPNSGSSSNRTVIKAGTVLGGKGNNDTEKLATGGVQVGVDKDGNANGDLSNVWVKTQKDGSKKALLATYNAAGQTNYLTNNPAEAIDRINEQGIRFFHVNDGNQEPVVQGRNGIDSSASGKHSVAIGFQAKADGEAAVAIGRQTQAGNQSIAIGDNAQATGDQSIAIGTGNVVAGKHSGAIGDPSTVKADNSYSVGNNNQFTDATQTDVFGVGNNITVTESNSVALGSNSAISAGTHAGTQAKKSDGTAGTTTTAGATGTVKGFAGQTAVGAVSVGASGAERRIQNVAAGEVSATSTDAVNGSQLYKATQGIANATNELDHRIHQNENKANAGISSAMAMASMPQAYIPGRSMVTGGIATHNGQGAVAVGLSKLSDNGQWVFKINGSADTQGHVGAAVGAGFHF